MVIHLRIFSFADGLTDLVIFHLFPDHEGRIWAMTYNSRLFHFDPEKLDFTPYKYNDRLENVAASQGVISSFHKTPEGDVYIGFLKQNGYIHVDADGNMDEVDNYKFGKYVTVVNYAEGKYPISYFYRGGFQYDNYVYECDSIFLKTERETLPLGWAQDNCIASKNLFGQDSVNYNLVQRSMFVSSPDTFIQIEFDEEPISVSQTSNGDVWVGFRQNGIRKVDAFANEIGEKLLPNLSITRVLDDHEGGHWFTSLESGLFYARSLEVKKVRSSQEAKKIQNILTIDEKDLYISYYNGTVSVMNRSGKEPETIIFRRDYPQMIRPYFDEEAISVFDRNNAYRITRNTIDNTSFKRERMILTAAEEEMRYGKLCSLVANINFSY